MQIHGRLDLTFAYVPTHLHYVLLELIKHESVSLDLSEGAFDER